MTKVIGVLQYLARLYPSGRHYHLLQLSLLLLSHLQLLRPIKVIVFTLPDIEVMVKKGVQS